MTTLRSLNSETLEVLQGLGREGKTGRLSATGASASRALFFEHGRIVGIRTSVDQERLGEILIRSGRITRQHFEDASVFVCHGWRLGMILTELGILGSAEVDSMVRRQAVEVACAILEIPQRRIGFDDACALFRTLTTPLSIEEVVIEAVRRTGDSSEFLERVRSDRRRFHIRENWNAAECASLTPGDLYLISRFQDGATLEDVLTASPVDEKEAARTLVGFAESGVLVATGQPSPDCVASKPDGGGFREEIEKMFQRLERESPWGALDLSRDASIQTAHAAFRQAVQRYHPDRHGTVTDPDLKKKLNEICSKFTDAFSSVTTALRGRDADSHVSRVPQASRIVTRQERETSSPSVAPARMDSSSKQGAPSPDRQGDLPASGVPDSQDPDVYVNDGKRAFLEGDYWRATQLLREAAELRDDDASIHFLLGQALAKNPRWRHEAEQSFTNAISLDPWRPEFYDALVQLYEDAGLHLRAERLVNQAREMGFLSGSTADAVRQDMTAIR